MQTLIRDLQFAARMLRKSSGFTLVAVVTLALGIGANTAIFSVVNAVLLRPLPYPNPDQLVMLWSQNPQRGWYKNVVYPADFLDWKNQSRSFESMAAFDYKRFNLTGEGEAVEITGERVSADFFHLLGGTAILGRTFLAEEDSPARRHVVVLGNGLWKKRYGADPHLLGKAVTLNGERFTVVGVLPANFQSPPLGAKRTELWVPLALDTHSTNRNMHELFVLGRLKPGMTIHQAQVEIDTIGRRLERAYPNSNTGWGVGLINLHEQVVEYTRRALLVLFGAVGFVLLIACANVANLMLARAAGRQKEIAIRTALGADRLRLVQQLLTESLLVSLAGGMLGLILALWGVDALAALAPQNTPGLDSVRIDAWVLAFTFTVSLTAGVVFGLAPAIAASRTFVSESLKEVSRGSTESLRRHKLRSALVVSEFALALVLLIGAGLMMKSFVLLHQLDLGFQPKKVLTMRISLVGSRYAEQRQQMEFFQKLLPKVQTLPGVQASSIVNNLPLDWSGMSFVTEDHPTPAPGELPDASYRVISAEYFQSLGIPLLNGRYFTDQDTRASAGVAIVNEMLARESWPGQNPIGKRIKMTGFRNGPWLSIVGLVGNVKRLGTQTQPQPEIYVPYTQYPWLVSPRFLVVKSATDAGRLSAVVRHEVASVDKDQPVSDIRMMEDIVAQRVGSKRFSMLLLAVFAGLALLLAAVGIYGVMSYSVSRRTHEMGIRMALGAKRRDLLKLVLSQSMALVLIGVILGTVAALGLTRVMATMLYEVSATDPFTFVSIAVTLAAVALIASYIPSRRAARVDPMIALRYE